MPSGVGCMRDKPISATRNRQSTPRSVPSFNSCARYNSVTRVPPMPPITLSMRMPSIPLSTSCDRASRAAACGDRMVLNAPVSKISDVGFSSTRASTTIWAETGRTGMTASRARLHGSPSLLAVVPLVASHPPSAVIPPNASNAKRTNRIITHEKKAAIKHKCRLSITGLSTRRDLTPGHAKCPATPTSGLGPGLFQICYQVPTFNAGDAPMPPKPNCASLSEKL